MKKKTKQPKHGEIKLASFKIETPYGNSKINVPVAWDKAVHEWMMTPEGMREAESEKARLLLGPETVDVQVGHDPKRDRYWLSITPPCFHSTTSVDLTKDDLLEIYHTIQSFMRLR